MKALLCVWPAPTVKDVSLDCPIKSITILLVFTVVTLKVLVVPLDSLLVTAVPIPPAPVKLSPITPNGVVVLSVTVIELVPEAGSANWKVVTL